MENNTTKVYCVNGDFEAVISVPFDPAYEADSRQASRMLPAPLVDRLFSPLKEHHLKSRGSSGRGHEMYRVEYPNERIGLLSYSYTASLRILGEVESKNFYENMRRSRIGKEGEV